MRKEIRRIDEQRNVVCVTTIDERWYARDEPHVVTGLPQMVFRPSVTWICDHYPKGKGFEIWLKKNGDDADGLAHLAAERGFKVHRAVAALNAGDVVELSDTYDDGEGNFTELTCEEYSGVMSYVDWWESEGCEKYEILNFETTLWPDAFACAAKYGCTADDFLFAGTLDLLVRRKADGKTGIIDMKTSLDIWPSHEMQVSAYKRACEADWCAILQLNYKRNKKKKWKFTEVEDCFDLFVHTKAIWAKETAGTEPLQRDFPLSLKLRGVEKAATV